MSAWPSVPLGSVAEVFNGKTPSKADQRSRGHRVLKIRDVDEFGQWRGVHESYVDRSFAERYRDKLVRSGDCMVLNAAHNSSHVASKTFRARDDTAGALATGEWLVVRPKDGNLDAAFIHHWINSPRTRSLLRDAVKGIHLYPKDVARLHLPLPRIEEQRRIAAILDKADDLRAKRRAALAQLDTLAEAIFVEMFGDPNAVHENGWETKPLIDLVDPARPISYGILMPGPDLAVGVPYVRVVDMKDGGIDHHGLRRTSTDISNAYRRSLLRTGDLLMSIRGHVGRMAVVTAEVDGANITQDSARIAVVGANPRFVCEYIRSGWVQHWMARRTKGVAVRGLNLTDLKKLPVPLPPAEAQAKFSSIVDGVDSLRRSNLVALTASSSMFGSLQQRAFSGAM